MIGGERHSAQRATPAGRTSPCRRLTARVRLLEQDPELGSGLPPDQVEHARRLAVAEVVELGRGEHDLSTVGTPQLLGLLVLQGLMIRSVAVTERPCGGELVGPGTLVRPRGHFGEAAPMPFDVHWRVIESTRVALLDQRVTLLCARWPPVLYELVRRAVERSDMLAFTVAIDSLQHVELRLLVLLWHLADRFGRVTPGGTLLPLRLTHRDLAQLVGCTRPTVSAQLVKLSQQGRVVRRPDKTWLLHGEPPEQLQDLRARDGMKQLALT